MLKKTIIIWANPSFAKISAVSLLEVSIILLLLTSWALSMNILLLQIWNYKNFLQNTSQELIKQRNLLSCLAVYKDQTVCMEGLADAAN